MFGAVAKRLFGSANDRLVKSLRKTVDRINALEPTVAALSDEQLRAKTDEFRDRLAKGETLDDLLVEAFAVVREGAKRTLGQRHFDVQLIGGMVLHNGDIAEMETGEGKTLVATLAAYLNALAGQGRPRRHRQRLPGPPRRRLDGPRLRLPRPHRSASSSAARRGDAARGLRLRHHLRHQQRARLRLPARQHEDTRASRWSSAATTSRSSTRSTAS